MISHQRPLSLPQRSLIDRFLPASWPRRIPGASSRYWLRATSVVLGTALALLAAIPASAQSKPNTTPPPISDNSFILEEAYNQEAGVVQHIFTYRRDREDAWLATFTQEWPLGSQLDQLSYTLPLQSRGGAPEVIGAAFGDLAINYRRQVLGRDEEPVWFAPRLSLVLPTGSVRKGTGAGGLGVQFNLPLSVRFNRALVTHWNAGASITRAENALDRKSMVRSVAAGASAIWLLAPTFNLMLESLWDRTEVLDDLGARVALDHFVILPGVRGAINLRELQIVPGIGVPIGIGPSKGERDLFLYLSFEHPF